MSGRVNSPSLQRWAPAIGASILVHLAAVVGGLPGWSGAGGRDAEAVIERPLSVRVVLAEPVRPFPAVRWTAAVPETETETKNEVLSPVTEAAVTAPSARQDAASRDQPRTDAVRAGSSSGATPLPVTGPAEPSEAQDLADPARVLPMVDGYVLRKALSTPPVPRGDIGLAWPEGWFADRRQSGVFTVFIDEEGRVRRMVIDGPTLAPALENAAQIAFKAARFEPGRVDGQAVKSLIRIEVEFTEDTPRTGSPVVVSRKQL